ncbi:UNVERIFIED_ORG: hypothetical protein BCL66_12630 [Martelella mediterranea]
MPICAYCLQNRSLCESHAIPDAFFRDISRRNSGKLIVIPEGPGKIHFGKNSGKAKILCSDCETHFNRLYDSPLVNALKEWDRLICQKGLEVRYDSSPEKIATSLAAIFWRASVSGNNIYANAKISHSDRALLLNILKNGQSKPLQLCSCKVNRLYDKTSEEDGGFKQKDISQIILPVSAYRVRWEHAGTTRYVALTVVMQGFLFCLMIPRLPFSKRQKAGFLNAKQSKLHAPALHLLDYEPLARSLVSGYKKYLDEDSTITRYP